MYAVLLNNANINYNGIGENNAQEIQRIKNIEIEVHKKLEKVNNLNSDSCYDFSDYSENNSFENSGTSFPKTNASFLSEKKSIKKFDTKLLKTLKNLKRNAKKNRIYYFKKIIKYMDIITCFITLIGTLLAQIENEDFYQINYNNRVNVVKLCNELDEYNWDILKIDFQKFNLNYLNSIEKFKKLKIKKCGDIPVYMHISQKGKILRFLIAITSLCPIPFIIIGGYLEYLREIVYSGKGENHFFSSSYFFVTLIETAILIPFPYPNIKSYLLYTEIGKNICYPYSSILSACTFFRVFFVVKLFKHLTKYTTTLSENICENYICKADWKFAFKAFQKDNPTIALIFIFIFTCVCLGLSIRTFERYYWESKNEISQDWDYIINCMWYVFVSMTTVGYGDMFACTQPGRVIALLACFIGNYFVAMMMVLLTQKSTLSENEKKSFELINRLRIRFLKKNIQSFIVYSTIKVVIEKYKIKNKEEKMINGNSKVLNGNLKENFIEEEDLKIAIEIRKINNFILKVENYNKEIDSYGTVPLKEILYNISERIDFQINDIKNELEELQMVNEIVLNYSEDLMNINRLLKKSLYANKLIYAIIQSKKEIFGKLVNVNYDIANVFDMKIDIGEIQEDEESKKENILGNKDYIECIYGLNQREFKEKFDFIFSKKINKNINRNYSSSHSLNLFKTNTRNSMRKDMRAIMFMNKQMKKLKKITLNHLNSSFKKNKKGNKSNIEEEKVEKKKSEKINKFLKKRFENTVLGNLDDKDTSKDNIIEN